MLDLLLKRRPAPHHIHFKNGPKDISQVQADWASRRETNSVYLQPANIGQNAFI